MHASANQSRQKSLRKERAPQRSNWLEFIQPHVDRYGRLPRGEQKKYLEKLSGDVKTSVKTLRAFLAAAAYLEINGITEFPEKAQRMPVASVEAIMRISKRDPARAKRLLEGVCQGAWTARTLQDELRTINKQPAVQQTAAKVSEQQLLAALGKLTGCHPRLIQVSGFELSDVPKTFFDRLAFPHAIAYLGKTGRVAVFDESAIGWTVSADRAKRALNSNVAVAATLLDFAVVFCSTLRHDLERFRSLMRAEIRDRIALFDGALDLPPEKALHSLAG
jgi:hypothetical protein